MAESREQDSVEPTNLAIFLDHLERRRASLDQGMWQAPALTIAAQAFLLQILTNDDVDRGARWAVLAGGLTAILAAVVGLLRGRSRELRYSEVIADYFVNELDSPDPRLPGGWALRAHYFWIFALLAFGVVDLVAFCLSD